MIDNCKWTWTTQNLVSGYAITAKNGNAIFLPLAGSWDEEGFELDRRAYYWSSSISALDIDYCGTRCAVALTFKDNDWDTTVSSRYEGLPVRPVFGPAQPAPQIDMLSISVSNISSTDCTLSFSTNNSSKTYYWEVVEDALVSEYGAMAILESYIDYYVNAGVLSDYLDSGNRTYKYSEAYGSALNSNTVYDVIAVFCDSSGQTSGDVAFKEFTTK